MTDSRLPARWLTDPVMDALTDRAWRTFTYALMWSNEAGTDGVIPQRSLRFLHPENVDAATLAELVTVGLVESRGGDIVVIDWERQGQELHATVEGRREGNRKRLRKHREAKKNETRYVTHHVTRDVTQLQEDRTGQERTGQAIKEAPTENRVNTWPVAVIPGSGVAS